VLVHFVDSIPDAGFWGIVSASGGHNVAISPALVKQASLAALAAIALVPPVAWPFSATITSGARALYLQVGTGTTFTGGNGGYRFGDTPTNNATINKVSVSVANSAVGSGVAQAMTSNSAQANSNYDNFAFCNPPAQVYIGGFYRSPSAGTATLSVVTSAASLINAGGNTIPFSQISWTSSGNGDTGAEIIPGGTFTGGTQTLTTFARNTWGESCHTFAYANSSVVAAGTYSGRATYTLSAT
jgi:hypothetical protein